MTLIITDGDLPIIDVRRIDVPEIAEVEHTDSRDKRPVQTVFGAGVAFFRGLAFLPVALFLFFISTQYLQSLDLQSVTVEGGRPALIMAGSVVAFIGLIDIGLAIAVLRAATGPVSC